MSSIVECKAVLLGQESTGKSSLVERLLNNQFRERGPLATIGVSYAAKRMQSKHGEVVVALWDTAGAEKFDSLSRLYYSGAQAALICVDLTDSPSFTKSQHWVKQLREHQPQCQCYIVLTKCDLLENQPQQLPPLKVPVQTESRIQENQTDWPEGSSSEIRPEEATTRPSESSAPNVCLSINTSVKEDQQIASPMNVLDRQSSSFGSSWSRSTGLSGNSLDHARQTKKKAVSDSQLQILARSINARLAYTSAATGQGVMELFQMIADDASDLQLSEEEPVDDKVEDRSEAIEAEQRKKNLASRRDDVVQLDSTQNCYRATKAACCG